MVKSVFKNSDRYKKFFLLSISTIEQNVFCEMPPIMANSNEGQDHKDTYFDTSRKILSQEMTVCNMEALVSYFLEVLTNVNFFLNWSNVKRLSTTKRSHHKGYSFEISKL